MTKEKALQYFPTKVIVGKVDPARLKYFLLAPPKWGKTKFFSGCPGVLLLAFEEGHFFARCPKVVITDWVLPLKERGAREDDDGVKYASAMEILDALESAARLGELPYKLIVLDTADMASKMCSDYECNQAGVPHPSDGGEYGKGFDLLQTTPFRRYYNRIVKLGVGVACTSHVKEGWYKDKFKQDVYRRESSLPGGVQKFIHSQSDVIIHGFSGKWRKGEPARDRIISFDGSDEILAGTRLDTEVYIPRRYIVRAPSAEVPDAPWKQWSSFFDNSPTAGIAVEAQYRSIVLGKVPTEDQEEEPAKPSEPLTHEPPKEPVT